MITTKQWNPPTQLDRRDLPAIHQLSRELASGICAYPAGSVGRGLYANECMPLLDRAAQAIIDARLNGLGGEIVGIVYFPRASDLDSFVPQGPAMIQHCIKTRANYSDAIAVFLKAA